MTHFTPMGFGAIFAASQERGRCAGERGRGRRPEKGVGKKTAPVTTGARDVGSSGIGA